MIKAFPIAGYRAGLNGTAILSSTRRVSVRAVRPEDEKLANRFMRGLSAASRYNRFMAAVGDVPKGWIEQFSQTARKTHFSLLASVSRDGTEIMIGEAQYAVSACGTSAELALSVADDWRNDGLGSELIKRLEAAAANAGVMRLSGDTLGENYAMRRLFYKAGFQFMELHASCLRFEKCLQHTRICRCE